MTDVFCHACHRFLGSYYGSPSSAGKELREKLGSICRLCGTSLLDKPVQTYFWNRGFWVWKNRRELPSLIIHTPFPAVLFGLVLLLLDNSLVLNWIEGVGIGLAMGIALLIKRRRSEKVT